MNEQLAQMIKNNGPHPVPAAPKGYGLEIHGIDEAVIIGVELDGLVAVIKNKKVTK